MKISIELEHTDWQNILDKLTWAPMREVMPLHGMIIGGIQQHQQRIAEARAKLTAVPSATPPSAMGAKLPDAAA